MDKAKNRFPLVLEAFIWIFYAGLYKYGYYLQAAGLPNEKYDEFPHISILFYAVALTLYIIPFYRFIIPGLLEKKRFAGMFIIILIYFAFVPKLTNWIFSAAFSEMTNEPAKAFYESQYRLYRLHATRLLSGWDFRIILTDCVAFLSLALTRYAFVVEQKKRLLEKKYFQLQLEALKAQLNPHFLFNMLNSIYGMSLAGSSDTPEFILKMSDMMRYILYDGRETTVPVTKDLQFIEHYIAMEKKRYPDADISFSIANTDPDKSIVPLLMIPFIENSFKHGAHRVNNEGKVTGSVKITSGSLDFRLVNDSLPGPHPANYYGGIGIDNVKKRLELYYPGRYQLSISNKNNLFTVDLSIALES